jgi:YD repeat-containing protein
VLNTLVWRGLPTERTLAAPAVTAWVHGLRDADPFLAEETSVILLGETASVTVRHPHYDALPGVPYQYRELLGCIWREPVSALLAPGERARTLAALLHTDPAGRSFTAELVHRSGLAPRDWLRRLFAALLPPLLHFLYRYGTVFSPHGENAVVVFDDGDVPVRLAVKDFPGPTAEDVYYAYDNHGRMLSARYASITGPGVVDTHDGLGRLASRTSYGRTLSYQYDLAGRRTRLTHPDGAYVSYAYNTVGELTGISDSTGAQIVSPADREIEAAIAAAPSATAIARSSAWTGSGEDIVDAYPQLELDDVSQALLYAADLTAEQVYPRREQT